MLQNIRIGVVIEKNLKNRKLKQIDLGSKIECCNKKNIKL